MNSTDLTSIFEELSQELNDRMMLNGKWESRRWKSNGNLRNKIQQANLGEHETLHEKVWALRNKCFDRPKCLVCGSKVNFNGSKNQYRETCSVACGARNPTTQKKIKQTCIDKWGGHFMQDLEWNKQFVKQNQEKGSYKKGQETLKKNHGVDNVYQLDKIKQKIKQTNLDRYGVEVASAAGEIKKKIANTVAERYGSFFNPDKTKQTNIERYGVENVMSNAEIKNKSLLTRREIYGSAFNHAKMKQTNLQRYGVETAMSNTQVAAKAARTRKEQYFLAQLPLRLESIQQAVLTIPCAPFSEWLGADHSYDWLHEPCGKIFKSNLVDGKFPRCPSCKPRSKPQEIIKNFLDELNISYTENNRTVIKPAEIDFVLNDLNWGIEVNGVYFHHDYTYGRSLLEKSTMANVNNFQILHFWDIEILTKLPIVKSIIVNKLGLSKRIWARNLIVCKIDSKESRLFFEQNHIDGAANATVHLGLKDKDGKLIAAASFGRNRFGKEGWEIIRFSTLLNTIVVGGLSKILKHFLSLGVCSILTTFADARFFTGHGYKTVGFHFVETTKPNYFYIKGKKILSRHQAMKHKLSKLLGENFDENKTETENMISSGWLKCSNVGNHKFIMNIS